MRLAGFLLRVPNRKRLNVRSMLEIVAIDTQLIRIIYIVCYSFDSSFAHSGGALASSAPPVAHSVSFEPVQPVLFATSPI